MENKLLGRVADSDGTVRLDVWRVVLDSQTGAETGFIEREKGRPVGQIVDDLKRTIRRFSYEYASLSSHFFHSSVAGHYEGWNIECPKANRVTVYAVTGGSEGHYVHVDLYVRDEQEGTKVVPLMLVKTFKGMAAARRIADRLADSLGV